MAGSSALSFPVIFVLYFLLYSCYISCYIQRSCDYCITNNQKTYIEDENHILQTCPLGAKLHSDFYQTIRNLNHDIAHLNIADMLNFNIAERYPIDDDHSQNTYVNVVRLACKTIHRLYGLVLEFKENKIKLPQVFFSFLFSLSSSRSSSFLSFRAVLLLWLALV